MSADDYEFQLVNRAASGDTVALTVLLTQAQQRLCAHIQRRIPKDLQGTVDADDILQEAQVEAYRHLHDFVPRGRTPSIDGWLRSPFGDSATPSRSSVL
jgi:DNA-directed RNA polymerase specialized sigma24 family protein